MSRNSPNGGRNLRRWSMPGTEPCRCVKSRRKPADHPTLAGHGARHPSGAKPIRSETGRECSIAARASPRAVRNPARLGAAGRIACRRPAMSPREPGSELPWPIGKALAESSAVLVMAGSHIGRTNSRDCVQREPVSIEGTHIELRRNSCCMWTPRVPHPGNSLKGIASATPTHSALRGGSETDSRSCQAKHS